METTEQLAGVFLEAVPDAIVVADARGRIVFANAQAERMFGYTKRELGELALEALLPARFRQRHVEHFARDAASPHVRAMGAALELFGLRRDGAEFPVEISISPVEAATGTVLIAAIRDATDRRRLEHERDLAATAAANARGDLQALLDHAPVMILAVDLQGRIEFINQTANPSREPVVGMSWLRHVPPGQHAVMESALATMLATGASQSFEVSGAVSGEPLRRYASHLGPIRHGEEIVGAVIVTQDITERAQAVAELAVAHRMSAVGTLAAGVAHEINTPIQFISDSVIYLRDAAGDVFGLFDRLIALHRAVTTGTQVAIADAAAAVSAALETSDLAFLREAVPPAFDRCVDGLAAVATIVRSMKEFARPSHEEMVPVDLNRAIETTLSVASHEYRYVAELVTELGELPLVTCHPGDINQVVLNIVVNAAHAIADRVAGTDRKGRLGVRTWREADRAVIAISDTGGGIPESIRGSVFEPFFTTKELGRGAGQGLALAWSIVKHKHGGDLTFETAVGEGTTFVVKLPIDGGGEQS